MESAVIRNRHMGWRGSQDIVQSIHYREHSDLVFFKPYLHIMFCTHPSTYKHIYNFINKICLKTHLSCLCSYISTSSVRKSSWFSGHPDLQNYGEVKNHLHKNLKGFLKKERPKCQLYPSCSLQTITDICDMLLHIRIASSAKELSCGRWPSTSSSSSFTLQASALQAILTPENSLWLTQLLNYCSAFLLF